MDVPESRVRYGGGYFLRASDATMQAMSLIETAAVLPAPPRAVWRLITDWERLGDWMLEASEFVVTSDKREGVGVEAEATIRIAGVRTRDRVRVTGWEPPRRLALEHLGWVKGTGEMHLTPVGDDTTYLFWQEELWPPLGLLGLLGLAVFRPLLARTFRRDLKALAELIR